jgi:hypothetical protein
MPKLTSSVPTRVRLTVPTDWASFWRELGIQEIWTGRREDDCHPPSQVKPSESVAGTATHVSSARPPRPPILPSTVHTDHSSAHKHSQQEDTSQFSSSKTDKPGPHVCGTCQRSFARLEILTDASSRTRRRNPSSAWNAHDASHASIYCNVTSRICTRS